MCFTVSLLDEEETKLEIFDKKKIKYVSVIKEHREVSLRVHLKADTKYVIVPSTRKPG